MITKGQMMVLEEKYRLNSIWRVPWRIRHGKPIWAESWVIRPAYKIFKIEMRKKMKG
jgi:hypothetical protein